MNQECKCSAIYLNAEFDKNKQPPTTHDNTDLENKYQRIYMNLREK